MFKFAAIETFKAKVSVMTPAGEEQEFTAEYLYLDNAAAAELVKLEPDAMLRRVWIGWSDIVGPDDKPLPFSAEQRDRFIAHAYVNNAVAGEYYRSRQGLRAKN